MELVHNWCKHVSVRKTGGIGIVEQMYGLPIGHMALECPNASAGGLATWDLADAAIDFHDRNCSSCIHRQPVGLPNIGQLVANRDAKVLEEKKRSEAIDAKLRRERAARNRARDEIRSNLTTVQQTVLDQIQELDNAPSKSAAEALSATARMAPEHFSQSVVEHLFDLVLNGSHYCSEGCFEALDVLQPDAQRLCALAFKLLARYTATERAASILVKHPDCIDPNLVPESVDALVHLANPRHYPIIGGQRRTPTPEPLFAVYKKAPSKVVEALRSALETRSSEQVEMAARGIATLAKIDPDLPISFARDLIAKLARARYLLPDLDDHDPEPAGNIRSAIVAAFRREPSKIDAVLQSYFYETNDDGKAAVIEVYRDVFRHNHFGDRKVHPGEAEQVAFNRIVWTATVVETPEALRFLQYAIHGNLADLTPSTNEAIDKLLGAAAVIDDKIVRLSSRPSPIIDPAPDYLKEMEKQNTVSTLHGIQDAFVRWACEAAGAGGPTQVAKLVAFLRQIPVDRENLRALVIGNFTHAAVSAEALNTLLPEYYSALVGPSSYLRSTAATTLGEFDRDRLRQLPDLVFEAFVPLITDRYVVVHRAAIRALRRIRVPQQLEAQVRAGLVSVINSYRQSHNADSFLLECLELLGDRYSEVFPYTGKYGNIVFAELMRIDALNVAQNIRFWARSELRPVPWTLS